MRQSRVRIAIGMALAPVMATPTRAARAADDPAPAITLGGETLIGRHDATPGVDRFLGIPYSAAPVGADLVVLDQDLFRISPRDIHKTKVLVTLFEGREVHGSLAALGGEARARAARGGAAILLAGPAPAQRKV